MTWGLAFRHHRRGARLPGGTAEVPVSVGRPRSSSTFRPNFGMMDSAREFPGTLDHGATWKKLMRTSFCPDSLFSRRARSGTSMRSATSLLIVATDRISAFDYVLPSLIPFKGEVLTQLSRVLVRLHLARLSQPRDHGRRRRVPARPWQPYREILDKRSMLVPQDQGRPDRVRRPRLSLRLGLEGIQGRPARSAASSLPGRAARVRPLPEPIFTPSTKAEQGHDENITFKEMQKRIGGPALAEQIRKASIDLYQKASLHALSKGIIIADTKFEFGLDGDDLILDRRDLHPGFLPLLAAGHLRPRPRPAQPRQAVRPRLSREHDSWDKQSDPPALPPEIIAKTSEKYLEIYRLLTGQERPLSRMSGFVDLHIHSDHSSDGEFSPAALIGYGPGDRLRRHLDRRPRHGLGLSRGDRGGPPARGRRGRPEHGSHHPLRRPRVPLSCCRSSTGPSRTVARSPSGSRGRWIERPGSASTTSAGWASTSPGKKSRPVRAGLAPLGRHDRPDPPGQARLAARSRLAAYYDAGRPAARALVLLPGLFHGGHAGLRPQAAHPAPGSAGDGPGGRARSPSFAIPAPISRTRPARTSSSSRAAAWPVLEVYTSYHTPEQTALLRRRSPATSTWFPRPAPTSTAGSSPTSPSARFGTAVWK